MCVCVCMCERERVCQHAQHISEQVYCMCACVCLRFAALSRGEAVASNEKQESIHHVH